MGDLASRHGPKTQQAAARSGGEAELHRAAKASCELLHVETLMQALRQDMLARVLIGTSTPKRSLESEALVKMRRIGIDVLGVFGRNFDASYSVWGVPHPFTAKPSRGGCGEVQYHRAAVQRAARADFSSVAHDIMHPRKFHFTHHRGEEPRG